MAARRRRGSKSLPRAPIRKRKGGAELHEHDMQAMETADWIWMSPTMLAWIVPIVVGAFIVGVFVRGQTLSATGRWRRMGRFLAMRSG